MAMIFKIKKGVSSNFEGCFGMLNLQLTEHYKTMSFKKIAHMLAKKYNIENGEIEMLDITFSWRKGK